MSLLNVLRSGVKVADKVTKPLQADVVYERVTGQNEYGMKTYAAPATLKAIVDWRQRQLRTPDGILSVSRAAVTFLDAAALIAATGGAGIDDSDRFTLPDGTTGPILDMGGFIDAGTGIPVATEVFLREMREINKTRLGAAGVFFAVMTIGLAVILVAAGTQPPNLPERVRDIARQPSTYIDARVLATDTAETVTVPMFDSVTGHRVQIIFSANCADYYVNASGTAVAPSADVTDGSGSERNPAALSFAQGATFSLVAPTACKVTMSDYFGLQVN